LPYSRLSLALQTFSNLDSAFPKSASFVIMSDGSPLPILLHLGDPIKWNLDKYEELNKLFTIVVNEDLSRETFLDALRKRKYGDFVAIYRPFWNTGGEMGLWDDELM
jgi:hypothetical protein